jgi:hypothetical protein
MTLAMRAAGKNQRHLGPHPGGAAVFGDPAKSTATVECYVWNPTLPSARTNGVDQTARMFCQHVGKKKTPTFSRGFTSIYM